MTDTPIRNIDDAEKRQDRIKNMVDAGLGYGEAQAVDDTSVHAVMEASRVMMEIVDRNARVLNLSGTGRAMAKTQAVMMMHGSMEATMHFILNHTETMQ